MSGSRSILRSGVLAGLLLSVAACGSGAPAPLPSPVGSKPASSGPTATPSPVRGSADVIKLDCSWGESIQSGIRHPVLGVDTDLAGARGTGTRPAGGPTFGGRMLIKSP